MATYYLDENGKLTTKKKKKKSTTYVMDKNGKISEERTWFQKGAFEDGYQFGDVTKSVFGTAGDLLEDAGTGILGMGEKAVDALMFLAPYAAEAQYYQNGGVYQPQAIQELNQTYFDEGKKANAEFIEKDLYNEEKIAKSIISAPIKNVTGLDIEEESVLGAKSDSLAQSAGQLGATVGLQMVGVPWFLTTGATSFGSEAENALKQGATYEEAGLSSLITAGAEILTEKLSGGIKFGGKTLDDVTLKPLIDKISNKAVKTLVNLGVDAVGEGTEEVISSVISNLGTSLYKDESISELLFSEEALDEYIESFIGGAVLGGGSSAIRTIRNSGNEVTFTENEQKVIDKEVEDRIKEREDAGETLTDKDKTAIQEQVKKDIEKGYISTDKIESVLGGQTYETYQAVTEQESALKKEIETLENLPKEQITVKQSERLTEARQQLKELDLDTPKNQLSMEVSEIAKGDRLGESYNEVARKRQVFEADLTKYNEKERAVVQKAVDSGILNNTNKTHDFVDMIARVSAEKGVSFNFTDNQKLKESGFAIEGATVNGFVEGTDVTLNIDSAKALNTVVGHEITHVLEGTELYGELQKVIKEYAEIKGDYSKRLEAIRKLYEGVEGANIDAEITADLVGDYLFTDSDFIKKLSAEKPNIFKRIFEEIKYLYKVATAGSKEARQLEKVKRAFEKAYRESGKVSNGDGVNLSLNKVTDNKVADRLTSEEWEKVKSSVANHKKLNHYFQKAADGGIIIPVNNKLVYTDANMDSPGISKIVEFESEYENDIDYAREEFYAVEKGKSTVEEAYEIVRLFTKIENINQYETENRQNDGKYDRRTGRGKSQSDTYHNNFLQERIRRANETINAVNNEKASSQDGVFFDAKNSGAKYSLSADSEGRALAPAIQKRFANSKAVDENGDLKVLYHGTPSGEFSIFDKSKGSVEGDFGSGFYFTDNEADVSEHYEGGGPDFENKVARRAEQIEQEEDIDYDEALERAREELFVGGHKFEVYLNIENPAIVGETMLLDNESYLEMYNEEDYEDYDDYIADVEQAVADDIENIVWEVEKNVDVYNVDGLSDVLFEAYYEGGIGIEELKAKINDLYLEDENGNMVGNEVTRQIIESLGYDGIIDPTVSHKWNMDMEEGTTHYIVFKPNQIKAVTNENPTDNPDIHKSLSAKSEHPVQRGNNNVYGRDIALQKDTAPAEEVVQEPVETVQEDIAPVVSDTEVAESVDWREEVRNMREPKLYYGRWKEEYIDYHNTVRRKAQKAALQEALDNFDSGMTPAELRQKAKEALEEYESAKPASGEEYTQAQEVMLAALYGQYSFYDSVAADPSWAEEIREQLKTPTITEEPAPITEEQASERDQEQYENFYSLEETAPWDSEEPWENFAPTTYTASVDSPFDNKDIKEVGNRKIKAYMYENPEVKPFFQEEAQNMLYELKNSVKGEKYYNDNLHYQTSGDMGWFGTTRMTSPEIAYLLDNFKYTYAEIEKGLNAIIEDHGAENNAVSKRIEFLLDERLREGYKHFIYGDEVPPNQGYINLLTEKHITEYNDEAFNTWASTLTDADVQAIAPEPETVEETPQEVRKTPQPTEEAPLYEAQPKKGVTEGQLSMFNEEEQATHLDRVLKRIDNRLEREKAELAEEFRQKKADLQEQLGDKNAYFSSKAKALYDEIINLKKGVRASKQLGYLLDYGYNWNHVKRALLNIYHHPDSMVNENLVPESIAREMLETEYEDSLYGLDTEYQKQIKDLEAEAEKQRAEARKAEQALTRKELHENIIGNIRSKFAVKGYDLDNVLNKAKDLSTFATVDNTPQRVMEKALGYKEGQVLGDLTVNQVAQNESEGIKWLNSFTDRKNGLLAQISKQYHIKPGSKASAAAQMYAEGFYVDENNDIVAYGDAELAKDFPNRRVQENIKGLAKDGRIRQIYDETLNMINESRTRNAYPEIPRLENYFLHFRAMDDTFSRLGLPFNPNDIRAKDLPTDLNGVTADLKPGQPYFASAKHRTGQRTSFDLLGGLERYLSSAKNQIYHIDDIQTLRALRNYIADTYGQAHGLEGLDTLTEDEAQERIKEVYGSHLSTFAKFLNEEANVLAGKTSLIDRGLEGIIGRRGITFLDTMNRQVGANMVGFNISSSLTNFISLAQAFAKSNKAAFVKAFAQTASNKLGSIVGRNDGFTEQSPVMIRRKGAENFYRTLWQKAGDAGYFLMGAVDNISTELIARTKYNELVSKGMDAQKAHYETDKWVSRLMGDRSLGQQPQIYNSKMLGILTKFQLEVRNQLDSQFYDTIQEAKVSNEEVQNRLAKNAKTAAKVTSTFFQLAVVQHLFGKAFESVAGYNPAFDIISVLIKALGFDDDDESEDTVLDNVEQGFLELLGDLPYTSIFTGGRIPIESALPIEQVVTGKDDYGNEKSRWETLGEAAPYYVLPGGANQIKKTMQGLGMFDDDLPIAGSYTDSGNLRFTVEDTLQNRVQAGVFGQWASDEARDYFDNERNPLKEKQIQELVDLDLPIREYWDYREGLAEQKTLEDKFDYIAGLDVPVEKKNIMINNVVDRKEAVDLSNYDDFADYEEFDFYSKNTEKYNFLQDNGVSYEEYVSSEDAKKEYDSAYSWYKNNPEKVTVARAVTDNVIEYRRYTSELNDIRADKDKDGDSVAGSAKAKKAAYINQLDLDYGQKIILFRTYYDSKEDKSTYNAEIVEYLNDREDISYEEMVTILKELDMKVYPDGRVEW